jgi:signal transduction histidine kinase
LENAARYSPEAAPIAIAVSSPGPAALRVTVRDRGPGIAEAEQARIFERFARGAASEGKGGLGIGLYLCRMIMQRHGGAIGVDSTVGDGAAFWIDLPR